MKLRELWPVLSMGNRIVVKSVLDGTLWEGWTSADEVYPEGIDDREVCCIGADDFRLVILLVEDERCGVDPSLVEDESDADI